jgi:hypothetical protein
LSLSASMYHLLLMHFKACPILGNVWLLLFEYMKQSSEHHDADGVDAHQFLKILTMRLCMTDLTKVLRRCTTLPDPANSCKKSVSSKNGCRSDVPLPCFCGGDEKISTENTSYFRSLR